MYVCADCREKSLLSTARFQTRSHSTTRRLGPSERCRSITTSTCRRAVEQHECSTSDATPLAIPITKDYGYRYLGRPRESEVIPKGSIREKLRTRSQENEQVKDDSEVEALAASGRLGILPDAVVGHKGEAEETENPDTLDYDDYLEGQDMLRLEPGTLLHAHMQGAPAQLAVFIGMRGVQHQALLADGRQATDVIRTTLHTVAIPSFITPDEVNALRPYFPQELVVNDAGLYRVPEAVASIGDVPRELAQPIMSRIAAVQDEMVAFQRAHVRELDQMYEQVADEHHYLRMDISDLTRRVLGLEWRELSDAAKMTVFHAVGGDSRHQVFHQVKSDSHTVIMNPKRMTRAFGRVLEWARQYQDAAAHAAVRKDVSAALQQNPLSAFIDKARRLIVRSRKLRSPTTIGTLGPSKTGVYAADGSIATRPSGEVYSANDRMILDFLWNTYIRRPRFSGRARNEAIGSLILRAIGAYPNLRLERRVGRLLLQEMGSLAPWSEDADDNLLFPLPGRRGGHVAGQMQRDTDALSRELGFQHQPSPIPLPDAMAHLRKDWGDTEVLCVDGKTTTLVDDGFSLEKCRDVADAYWVHVHIAHASAYIDPEHPFAQRAQHFSSSVYTTTEAIPMMPRDFVETLGVRPGAAVLTISTLLAADGAVKAVEMTPGRIRKCVYMEPAAVASVLGEAEPEEAFLRVGPAAIRTLPVDESHVALARDRLETLSTLKRLCLARFMHRQKAVPEFANWELTTWAMKTNVVCVEPYIADRLEHSYHYLGEPTINVRCSRWGHTARLGDHRLTGSLVANLMLLAGESAGQWLKERQVPAIYHGSFTHPEYPLSRLNQMSKDELTSRPSLVQSATPMPHVMSNLSQYVRVTSPLRRFSDLVAQWQIDAVLRAEAAGTFHDGTRRDDLLPWTETRLTRYLQSHGEGLLFNDHRMNSNAVHWLFQAFFRAFHFKEAPLPDVWDMSITGLDHKPPTGVVADDTRLRGFLMPFRVRAHVLTSKEGWERGAKLLQYLPVKIELVDVDIPAIFCRAVGPLSDTPTQSGPIHIATPTPPTPPTSDTASTSPTSNSAIRAAV